MDACVMFLTESRRVERCRHLSCVCLLLMRLIVDVVCCWMRIGV